MLFSLVIRSCTTLIASSNDLKGLQIKETSCFNKIMNLINTVKNPVQADAFVNKQITKIAFSGIILGL